MSKKARDRILSAVELGLGFPPRDESLLTPRDPASKPNWLDPETHWQDLARELEAISARFHRVANLREAQAAFLGILKEHAIQRAIRWEHPLLEAMEIDDLLREAGVAFSSSTMEAELLFQEAARADLGITAAEALLVESGTVVVKAMKGRERCASLLPPVHLAIVTPHQMLRSVLDLVSLWRQWLNEDGRLPSAIHLISGPSRTADIELTLILGAHGPKILHILLLDPAWLKSPADRVPPRP